MSVSKRCLYCDKMIPYHNKSTSKFCSNDHRYKYGNQKNKQKKLAELHKTQLELLGFDTGSILNKDKLS